MLQSKIEIVQFMECVGFPNNLSKGPMQLSINLSMNTYPLQTRNNILNVLGSI